ncbi:MAG: nucleoside 2-deoxyribosyltransferase [Limisphaerales bacterium]
MTITVAGGWYEELCAEPHWYEYYGPGGRAAVALAGRKAAIRLLTYCPAAEKEKLEYLAKAFGFAVETFGEASPLIRFQYLHWLRPPQISPASAGDPRLPPIRADDAESAIRYGFYEGDAILKSRRAVYDPQSAPERVQAFTDNGSTAEQLSVVCNFAEGSKLTGETSPQNILDSLLNAPNIVAVALKGAWEGVFAATKTARELIPPTPTVNVHKIGSGDLFTAEFAYGWMALGLDPIAAARRASLQVAHYTNSASLPVPESATITPAPAPRTAPHNDPQKKYDLYVAGPFFNYSQLSVVEEMAALFTDAGLRVFSPYHDVGLNLGASHAPKIAKQDIDGLRASRILVACLEGYDPGTVFEVGYARAIGIPVLLYAPNLSELNSTMFLGTSCQVARDLTTAVYRAVWWAKAT